MLALGFVDCAPARGPSSMGSGVGGRAEQGDGVYLPPEARAATREPALGRASIAAYLGDLASGEPAPGGGSAVGLAGAMAASLTEMVCNLTVGRRAYAAAEGQLEAARDRASALRVRLLTLAEDDAAAYGQYMVATKLPKGTDAERLTRHAALQDALLVAADVPLAVAEACLEILETLGPVAAEGNRHAVSDATVAAYLAEAAVRGAVLNVRTNAAMMDDATRADGYLARAAEAEAVARQRGAEVATVAASR